MHQQPSADNRAMTRSTQRRQSCLETLAAQPRLLPELRWRVWLAERAKNKTDVVCSRSTDYRFSFERSLQRWEQQEFLFSYWLNKLKYPITYGMAGKLAVYTILERGLMSSDRPEKSICLYFGRTWCSVVVSAPGGLAVNLGAVYVASPGRYRIVSDKVVRSANDLLSLSEAPWFLRHAESGEVINAHENFPKPKTPRQFRGPYGMLSLEPKESSAKEGVALAVKRQYPGGIAPYLLPGEWSSIGVRQPPD